MGYIVVNIDKKQYLRPEAFGENGTLPDVVGSYQGVMLALVVLLADSNGRGGGDLSSSHEAIGSWAGDRIIIVDEQVCMPEFSEPGMAEVPLQKQMLAFGTDVSSAAFAAIVEGERAYSRLGQLNAQHVLSLVEQSKLLNTNGGAILTAAGRATRLTYLEELFGVVGEALPMATKAQARALEEGVNRMARLLDRAERYEVVSYRIQKGFKETPAGSYARQGETVRTEGVTQVEFGLKDAAGNTRNVVLSFGANTGTSFGALYELLFPGIELERAEERALSPEVNKLLSFLSTSPKGAE
jgi:hypothetical protein